MSMPGFRTFAKTDVPVTLNNVTRVDVIMEVGEVTETGTIESKRPCCKLTAPKWVPNYLKEF